MLQGQQRSIVKVLLGGQLVVGRGHLAPELRHIRLAFQTQSLLLFRLVEVAAAVLQVLLGKPYRLPVIDHIHKGLHRVHRCLVLEAGNVVLPHLEVGSRQHPLLHVLPPGKQGHRRAQIVIIGKTLLGRVRVGIRVDGTPPVHRPADARAQAREERGNGPVALGLVRIGLVHLLPHRVGMFRRVAHAIGHRPDFQRIRFFIACPFFFGDAGRCRESVRLALRDHYAIFQSFGLHSRSFQSDMQPYRLKTACLETGRLARLEWNKKKNNTNHAAYPEHKSAIRLWEKEIAYA